MQGFCICRSLVWGTEYTQMLPGFAVMPNGLIVRDHLITNYGGNKYFPLVRTDGNSPNCRYRTIRVTNPWAILGVDVSRYDRRD